LAGATRWTWSTAITACGSACRTAAANQLRDLLVTAPADNRRLIQARYNREAGENGVVVNLANVVSVRVSKTDSATTGQYL
jgi:hypothetical protein